MAQAASTRMVVVTLQDYHRRRREQRQQQQPVLRALCLSCLQAEVSCYCPYIQRFDSKIKFVILIHPIEARRRIATGRMSYLCLEHSHLIKGQDYSLHPEVNRLVNDPQNECAILFPAGDSMNLSDMTGPERRDLFPRDKQLVVFVIDGTWGTAGKTLRQSENLKGLPRLHFTPLQPSNFRVRKQPRVGCYATIEAIHHTIELLGPGRGFELQTGQHDNLLRVFNHLVEQQITLQKPLCPPRR